ncbi:MAG: 16S rRNA (cytosine(967)-C(5))-methyltransferase RsmB [Lachnospiraceae bacterium]|nr:16S rRNA (cytosine(967)-C(5))-methyltransferase RsmB [Lachnospiraceae bacterium]
MKNTPKRNDASVNPRKLALSVIMEVLEKEEFSDRYLHAVLAKYGFLSGQERAFISRLSLGTIENALLLDGIINQYSKIKVKKMKPVVRNVLRLSVYQIYFMDSVPESAIVNEGVKLVKQHGLSGLGGFVNGVLRGILRDKKPLSDFGFSLAIRYSFPEELVADWQRDYDPKTLEQMLSSFGKQTLTSIRTNLAKITPEELKERLEKEGLTVECAKDPDYAFYISGYDHLEELSSFKEGLFYVQDVSSMLVAERAGIKGDDFVLDVCAAPGGKSVHIAQKMEVLKGSGRVESRDVFPHKVKLIEENIRRFGLSNMSARVWDAKVMDESAVAQADVVIADLPCSGLGVIGKKPEIKYRVDIRAEEELAALQREILSVVCRYVRPGGRLVYSTCTIDRRENEDNREWFLENHPEFTPVSEEQILPLDGKRDGFYIAVFTRKPKE